ncbi:hypothetical protein MNBD_UNCLBAC01-2108 [hydrothermal vent metagenome]|uniref:Methylamine utilisation protein MauE domain-containing protein n=1 Tax=hydrothermal vent metagenome TaxID=652676 RepID=A0A3B1DTF8_9ZZZZ
MHWILRILLGAFFVFSGFEKIITPYQNFLYVIQTYDFLPPSLEFFAAHTVPWIELFLGFFCLSGLWLRWSLGGIIGLLMLFILIVAQAIMRDLPITECGCFGESLSLPLPVVILFDSTLLLLTGFLLKCIGKTSKRSLDKYFDEG